MGYEITKKLITHNNPQTLLQANGAVLHNTGEMGDTAMANRNYFDTPAAEASAHFVVDAKSIVQCIETTQVAWHAGPTANRLYWGIELCTTSDPVKFNEIWKRGVWLFADLFKSHGIANALFHNLRSHAEVSEEFGETDHYDPVDYFDKFGVTVNMFRAAVQKAISTGEIQDLIREGVIQMQLQLGDKSNLVAALQTDLKRLGYDIDIDGVFGEETLMAVENFQIANNLSADGIVGHATDAAIAKAIQKQSNDAAIKSVGETAKAGATPQWKVDGAKYLKDSGITSDLHDPLEKVDIGTLGVILKRALGKPPT